MCDCEAECDDASVRGSATECHFVQLSANVIACVSLRVAVQVWD